MAIRDSQRELAVSCRNTLLDANRNHTKLVQKAAIDMTAFQENPGQPDSDDDDQAFGFIGSMPLQTSK